MYLLSCIVFFPAEDENIDVEGLSAAFGQMQGDLDRQRLLGEQRPQFDPVAEIMAREIEHQERYCFANIRNTWRVF